jgi:hypothetical protein
VHRGRSQPDHLRYLHDKKPKISLNVVNFADFLLQGFRPYKTGQPEGPIGFGDVILVNGVLVSRRDEMRLFSLILAQPCGMSRLYINQAFCTPIRQTSENPPDMKMLTEHLALRLSKRRRASVILPPLPSVIMQRQLSSFTTPRLGSMYYSLHEKLA